MACILGVHIGHTPSEVANLGKSSWPNRLAPISWAWWAWQATHLAMRCQSHLRWQKRQVVLLWPPLQHVGGGSTQGAATEQAEQARARERNARCVTSCPPPTHRAPRPARPPRQPAPPSPRCAPARRRRRVPSAGKTIRNAAQPSALRPPTASVTPAHSAAAVHEVLPASPSRTPPPEP